MKKHSFQHLLSVVVIGVFVQFHSISAIAQSKVERLNDLMSQYVAHGKFNGSVLVAEKGKVIYKKGFGLANMEWDIPNDSDTKHRLGSVTKQFTSMMIMQLVEEGKLKLDENISTYLTDYPKETGDKITVHQLLSHTSGVPNYTAFPNFFQKYSRDEYTPEEFIQFFSDSSLVFEPGEKFEYSNSGYFLLGVLIEEVTGKTYEQVLYESILKPLKMNNTGFDHHKTILKKRATGYEINPETGARNSDYLDMTVPFSAGSMYSTVEDLYLWDRALYTDQLLSKKYRKQMFLSHADAGAGNYGYGWMMMKSPKGQSSDMVDVLVHSGGIHGFNTLIVRIPSEEHLIVLLNNTGGTVLDKIGLGITGVLYDQGFDSPQKSLAFALYGEVMKNGVSKGVDWFQKNKDASEFLLKEGEMNMLGYKLLQSGMIKRSIEIFKLNVQEFPESGNAFDSLGEAYLADGDKKMAKVNYKRAVELDPENLSGAKILKDL
jgi:CubicO group peptidase (beta-lactamase class C family)